MSDPLDRPPTVAEAQAAILAAVPTLPAIDCPLAAALGAVLAEEVTTDIDLPPFDCSAMDGYAVRADDLASVPVVLPVIEQLTAGRLPTNPVRPGTCSQIMTGAVVPEGADAVVMVEHTEPVDGGRVRFLRPVDKRNIRRRGEEVRAGHVVLSAGTVVRPAEIGLLASVGRADVRVIRRPTVAILATGDELIDVDATPRPGQIRNSNGPTLEALCTRSGFPCVPLGVVRDTPDDLEARARRGLEYDVLLVSAGVSVGEFDLVPRVLKSLGVEVRLHGVRVKPGKPVLFGTAEGKSGDSIERLSPVPGPTAGMLSPDSPRVVFGLPGKPVSTIVAWGLFVLPALKRMAGWRECLPEPVPAVMKAPFRKKAGRHQFEPAYLVRAGDHYEVEALPTRGSGDLAALCRANALLAAPANAEVLDAGDRVDVLRVL